MGNNIIMKNTAHVIIGAGYGDEGKGLATDFFSSENSTVVRFNGGAQAGHTVVNGNETHVFSHFGAGSFKGANTFLSKHFICNPILFLKELEVLQKKIPGFNSLEKVFVSENAIITTPYDMLINQFLEDSRKTSSTNHGSCGVGINETVERHDDSHFTFDIADIQFYLTADPYYLHDVMIRIRDSYVPRRLFMLGLVLSEEQLKLIDSPELLDKFIDDCITFRNSINIVTDDWLKGKENLVFEGAQGLMLDQNSPNFPHVTRSNTGLKNVMELCDNLKLSDIKVHYVTRSYVTKHGAGPLLNETEFPKNIQEKTNITNRYQENFRYAPLDLNLLKETILTDWYSNKNDMNKLKAQVSYDLFVTWLDTVENRQILLRELCRAFDGCSQFYFSNGPSSLNVELLELYE